MWWVLFVPQDPDVQLGTFTHLGKASPFSLALPALLRAAKGCWAQEVDWHLCPLHPAAQVCIQSPLPSTGPCGASLSLSRHQHSGSALGSATSSGQGSGFGTQGHAMHMTNRKGTGKARLPGGGRGIPGPWKGGAGRPSQRQSSFLCDLQARDSISSGPRRAEADRLTNAASCPCTRGCCAAESSGHRATLHKALWQGVAS